MSYILVRENLGKQKKYGIFSDLEGAIKEFCGLAPEFFSHVPQCPTPKELFEEYNETIIEDIEVHGIWQEYGDEAVRGQFIIIEVEEATTKDFTLPFHTRGQSDLKN